MIKPNMLSSQIATINTEAYITEGNTWYAFINSKGFLCCRSGSKWGKDEYFTMLNIVVKKGLVPFALYQGNKVRWEKNQDQIKYYRESDNMLLYKIVL